MILNNWSTSLIMISLLLMIMMISNIRANESSSSTTSTRTQQQEVAPSTTYCNCQYNVPLADEADCRSYGQLGDDVLIPWYRANQTCLDEYQIKISTMDLETLLAICPYGNATNVDLQLLLNEVRSNPSPATRAIQAYYPIFWTESNTTVGSFVLVDVINDGRNNPNCKTSETLCYNTIREYFTINPAELGTACKEFHARRRFDMDLEQSAVRIRVCQEVEVNSGIPNCEPLVSQVIEIKEKNPSRSCAAFGLGPGTNAVPTPSNCGSSGKNSNTVSTSNGGQHMWWYGSSMMQLAGRLGITLLIPLLAT